MYRSGYNKRSSKRPLGLFVFVLSIIVLILFIRKQTSKPQLLSPIPIEQSELSLIEKLPQEKPKKIDEKIALTNKIQELVGTKLVNYSVYIKNIKGEVIVDINSTVIFPAASVNKLPILASLYSLIESGKINPDESITIQSEDIQDYGTGSIRYDKPGSVYSIKTLAQLMIQKSDNTAEYIIANHIIGINQLQQFTNLFGLTQTDIAKNQTSTRDAAMILEKIFVGEIAGPARTKEMLAFLKNTDFEDRIPYSLPKDIAVYHKIGNGDKTMHDIGVVDIGKSAFIIGIMTNDFSSENQTQELIRSISKTAYDMLK